MKINLEGLIRASEEAASISICDCDGAGTCKFCVAKQDILNAVSRLKKAISRQTKVIDE